MITVVASLTTAPVGFLAGIGSFDYWLYYISGRPTVPDDHASHGAYSWRDYFKVNTDHKVIGVQYLVTTFFFFIAGGLMAMLFRAELAQPDMQYVDTQTFNGLVSEHAALMIFLIIPAFAGLANFAVPLMLGAPDMAFPRLNALSYWLLPIAGIMFLAAFLAPGGAFGAGWTGYAPLAVEGTDGNIFFQMGVQWAGASSIMTALNFLVTIITMRAGMTFWRLPLLVWANFTTSLLVVIATPFIAGSQFFALRPGDAHELLQRLQRAAHARVPAHLLVLLAPGRLHHDAARLRDHLGGDRDERKPVFGYRPMALSLMAILVLGFRLGAPHVRGRDGAWLRVPMMVTSMIIAVPTGIKIFSWLATMWEGGRLRRRCCSRSASSRCSCSAAFGHLPRVGADRHRRLGHVLHRRAHPLRALRRLRLHDLRRDLLLVSKMTGRMYDERLGKLHFWLTFIGFNGTFFPMHVGLQGMPCWPADYADQFGDWNLVISLFSFMLGASTIIFFYNVIVSWTRGPIAPPNLWRALTLEWQVSSPPPVFNFDEIPQVVGALYEYGVPGARHAVLHGGAHVELPETAHEEETVR